MDGKLINRCSGAAAVALAYDAGMSVIAAVQGQPVSRMWSMGLLVCYAAIGFTGVRSLSFRGALIVSAAAGTAVGTLGSLIAFALRVLPEFMPSSPLAEVMTAVLFGSLGAGIGGLFFPRAADPGST